MNAYVESFRKEYPNPSPPLPNNNHLLEELAYWPQDASHRIYIPEEEINLRDLFLKVKDQWPETMMEQLTVKRITLRIVDAPEVVHQTFFIVERSLWKTP